VDVVVVCVTAVVVLTVVALTALESSEVAVVVVEREVLVADSSDSAEANSKLSAESNPLWSEVAPS
jgi:hypothetical protein